MRLVDILRLKINEFPLFCNHHPLIVVIASISDGQGSRSCWDADAGILLGHFYFALLAYDFSGFDAGSGFLTGFFNFRFFSWVFMLG